MVLEVLKAEALLGLDSCSHGVARQGKTVWLDNSPTNNNLIFPASHIAQLFPRLVTIVTFGPSNAPLACLT